jgi:SNF2 family DNA or RNA helicase
MQQIKRSAEGVIVQANSSWGLLSLKGEIDLRWSAEAIQFANNRQRALEIHRSMVSTAREILEGGKKVAEQYLMDIQDLEALDDHQWVNVAVMALPESYGMCVFDEQGAGKTVTMIYTFDALVSRDIADFLLVVAPKSMVAEWKKDFARFKGDLYYLEIASGSRKEKAKKMASGCDVLVTNFETAQSMEAELRALLRGYSGRAVLAVDESFFIKNLDAKRTRALRRLREWCGRAYVLCGTPAPNAPHDLVQQFNIVDFGRTFGTASIPEDREEALPVVQTLVEDSGIVVRHLKADVMPDLPEKRFHRVFIPLNPVQERLYRAALNGLIEDLQSISDGEFMRNLASFLARRSVLLQICSNPSSLIPGYDELPAKVGVLDSLLTEIIEGQKEKAVLWSFYTSSLDALFSRYRAYNPVRYDGTISDVRLRGEYVERFQEDDSTMLFIGNPAAAGAGLTLHRAHIAIYESFSNQAAHYLQSIDRIHRRGQAKEVEYVVLLCDRTIEIPEYERLLAKEQQAQELLGDIVDEPITRESMLSEMVKALRMIDGEDNMET